MSRTTINFLLDAGLGLVFLMLVACAVVVQYVFPPSLSAQGWTLLGWSIEEWQSMEFALICVLAVGLVIHVMLHWSWVCGVVASRLSTAARGTADNGIRTIYGVGLLIVVFNLVGFAVAIAAWLIRGPN